MEKYSLDYIVECINKFCILEDLSEDTWWGNIMEPLKENNCFPDISYVGDAGVTKCAIIFPDLGYVVKIPFQYSYYGGSGRYTERTNENGEKYETWVPEEDDYVMFSGARNSENDWDYCKVEVELYQSAITAGMEKYFAKMERICNKEYPIYYQPLCKMFESYERNTTNEKEDEVHREYSTLKNDLDCALSPFWVKDFIETYGLDEYNALIKFCEDYSIQDFHCGNIGYINEKPVIVDYGSFWD